MPSVVRWTPFNEALSMRHALDRMFEESFVTPSGGREVEGRTGPMALPVDMYETEEALVLKTRLPGVNPDDVKISINGDNLLVKAEFASDAQLEDSKDWSWYRHELFHGAVARSITLPTLIQPDNAEAIFRHGELTLTLPKAEEVKPRSIKITTVE